MKELVKETLNLNIKVVENNKLKIAFNFIIWLSISGLPLVYSLIIKNIIENLQNNNILRHQILCGILMIVGFGLSFAIISGGKMDTLCRFNIRQLLRKNLMLNIVGAKKSNPYSTGEVIEIISTDLTSIEELISIEIDLLCKLIFAIVSLVVLFKINFHVALYSLIPMIIVSQVISKMGNYIKENHNVSRDASIQYNDFIGNVIGSREAIQLMGANKQIYDELKLLNKQRMHQSIKQNVFYKVLNETTSLSGILSISLILILSISEIKNNRLSAGDLSLFINLVGYISLYNNLFTEIFCSFKYTENTLTRINNILNVDLHKVVDNLTTRQLVTKSKDIEFLAKLDEITFNHVYMSTKDKQAISFCVSPKEFFVICGKTGSGKTHLVDTILGYCDYEGTISYGNRDIKELDINKIAILVNQEPVFLDETPNENIHFSLKDKEIDSYLKLVNLYNEINKEGLYSEKIGVNGKKMSEGQRQRLAIARGVAHASNILILDDSTSLLDYNNEKDILKKLKNLPYTIIMISNRRNVLHMADRILVLKNEEIDEINTLDNLLEHNYTFNEIYNVE